jgi:hypothetical protein
MNDMFLMNNNSNKIHLWQQLEMDQVIKLLLRNTKKKEMKIFLLDQHDGNGEQQQQRESDISKSVDHIELLCQDQVRI